MIVYRNKILVVGQTPPPFGGQAVMIQALLDGKYNGLELHHVRLAFSDDMDSVGKFKVKKILILFTTIFKILWARINTGAKTLYYPPSGPDKVPVLRDIILLNCVRWAFSRTIFHFHAGGVSVFRSELGGVLKWGFDRAYRNPALAVMTSELNPDDGLEFGAKENVVVYNGLRDEVGQIRKHDPNKTIQLLFVGVVIPSKGVDVLLETCGILAKEKIPFDLKIMGRPGSMEYDLMIRKKAADLGIQEQVEFLGVKTGLSKFEYYASCDIFCFPSYFESESFGLVCVEAMMFSKPVVTTNWRGIPTVVQNDVNGFLVPIQDPTAFAERLKDLINNPELRIQMGTAGRRIYEELFTVEKFRLNMEKAILRIF